MVEKILFSLAALLLFLYIFAFKLIKKNDTTYLVILVSQAIGILLNFIEIIFNIFTGTSSKIIMYLLCLIIPSFVLILESKGIDFSEIIYIGISKILLLIGKRKKAKEVLIKLISKFDKSYMGHRMLAEIYEQEGGMRKAIDEYVKVLDIGGNDYKSYFKISKLLKDLKKDKEAIEMLTILAKKKPELYESSKMLGDLLIENKKFKSAAHIYTQAIKYNPDKADLYYNLGVVYSMVNEFSLAKECFEKTIEIDSNFYNSYYRLGQIALLYRDIESAERYFTQSLYGETEAKSYYQLAKIYIIKNDKNKSGIFINRAIEMNSKYYDIAINEPIFFPIRQTIEKPINNETKDVIESEKERTISEYLDNTYDLTKVLNEKKNKKSN